MSTRRSVLAGAVCAFAAPLGVGWPKAAGANEHWVAGGSGGIQRAQYGFAASSTVGGVGLIKLPQTGVLYMIPLTVQAFDESGGGKFRMLGDGLVTIMEDGLYEVTANVDWASQARPGNAGGFDTDGRKLLVKRDPVGVAPPRYVPGHVTQIPPNAVSYDSVAGHDTSGASSPNIVRASASWSPGTIAPRAMASTEIALPTGSFTPAPGDLALASHSGLSDALLGAANKGLLISARLVAPGLARVTIENRYNATAVAIPAGTVSVLAESAVSSAGGSGNAWTWEHSGRVELFAGEKLMVAVRSESQGDFLQVDGASFLRIRNIVP